MTENLLFGCVFCDGKTKPIPHDSGKHLVICKCENCNVVLFFAMNEEKGWRFKSYERPKDDTK